MGFGPPARNRKKIAPEIGPEIGPAEKIGKKKKAQNPENPNFFPIFSPFLGGVNFGTNLGSYFFLFRAGGPKPIFYQVGGFSTQILRKYPKNAQRSLLGR